MVRGCGVFQVLVVALAVPVALLGVHTEAYLAYLPLLFPQINLDPYPSIRTTIKHVQQRPAYRKAMGQE